MADHPAVRAVNKAREVVVATMSSSPPPVGSGTIVTGVEVTLSEARLLTGLPVTQPTAMTTGFRLLVSQYYPATITAREGGLFALTYENGSGASISIYQEAGTENDLSVAGGASVTTLSGGQTATYFFGHWQEAGDGMLSWQDGQSQTLTYAWNGVRVIIQYSGPHIHSQLLVDIANNMVGQPQ